MQASRMALLFVLLVIGGAFIWWFRHRPSFLLYQANRALNSGNQAALVTNYQRALRKTNLPKEDEIRLRKALGRIYLQTFQNAHGVILFFKETGDVESPYIGLAKKEFDRVLALEPNDSEAHYALGRILWFRRLETYAMEEFEKSRRSDPTFPEPLAFLAEANLERGNATAARELALQALAIAPGFGEARRTLVNAYAALGDYANVDKQYDLLSPDFKTHPQMMASYAYYLALQNRWTECLALMKDAERLAPNDGWVKITFGRMLLEQGRVDEAAGMFIQAGKVLPDSVWPRVHLTESFALRGLCDEAVRASQPLVETMPNWCWSPMMNAWTQLCRFEPDRALFSLDEALRLAPDLREATFLKAHVLIDVMRFEELGNVVRLLLAEKRHESEANALLAESFLLQGKRDLAQETASAAIQTNQRNAHAYTVLGLARAQLKDRQGSDWAFEMALGLRPFDAVVKGSKAFAESLYFQKAGAREELKDLLSKNGGVSDLWLLWGDLNRQTGNYYEAETAYQNAAGLKPYLLKAHLGVMECAFKNERNDSMDAALTSALRINSKNPEVLAWRKKIHALR